MERIDILLDNDFDLQFLDGDFAIDDSQYQELKNIIIHKAGDYKQFPNLGVGIQSIIGGQWTIGLKQAVVTQLASDNYQARNVKSLVEKITTDVK